MFTIDYNKNVNLSFHSNILPVNIIHKYIIVYNRNNTLYIELQSIMNERDKSDLCQVDNQIYHELNQPAGERDVEVYNELSHPGERNKRYYDEVNNIGQSYYQELRPNQPAEHTIYHACNQRSSPKQVSIDNKLQLIIKIVLTVVLLIMLFLLVISNVLIAVIFNNLNNPSTSTAGVVDDILLVVEELLGIQNASVLLSIQAAITCKDIKTVLPNSPTGYYHVNSRNIYCNMGELCGTEGGWTRLAYLDMSDSTVNCPTGFRLYQSGGVRACGRPVSSGGSCSSVQYPSNGISYSQICGRVVGYQYRSTDAVGHISINDINSYYVDGVSITHGSPRQHIWTLMAGFAGSVYTDYNCPCNTPPGGTQQIQSFVESNYFCESGNSNGSASKLFTDDPLWDGQGCGTQEVSCCSVPGLPWFHRDYGNVTTMDYIELRVCADQPTYNEDVPVSFYEIYVN